MTEIDFKPRSPFTKTTAFYTVAHCSLDCENFVTSGRGTAIAYGHSSSML